MNGKKGIPENTKSKIEAVAQNKIMYVKITE